MKRMLMITLIALSLTACSSGKTVVVVETEYVLPASSLLETHSRPTLLGRSKNALMTFIEQLKGSVMKYETDKDLLRQWKDQHQSE